MIQTFAFFGPGQSLGTNSIFINMHMWSLITNYILFRLRFFVDKTKIHLNHTTHTWNACMLFSLFSLTILKAARSLSSCTLAAISILMAGLQKRLSMDCEIETDLITLCNQKQIQALQRLIGALFYNKSLVHVRACKRKMKFH